MFISRKRGFMTFSGKIKVSIALLMAVGSCAMAAKSTSGKVIEKLGDAKLQKAANVGTWTEISFGNRVKEKDQIRTGIESHVAIALSDGSSISIEENSLVEFTTLEAENGIQTALTDVKTGKVKFDAQKQHSGGSFKFKTATATAAIRGTHGYFGRSPIGSADFLSIGEGRGSFSNINGNECDVTGGHTAFVRKGSTKCHLFAAKSSGNRHFIKILENILDDDKKSDEQVMSEALAADTAFQADLEKASELLKCQFEPLEDTITTNSVTIKGACNAGVKLVLAGAAIENSSGFEFTTSWASTSGGAKKFNANCSIELDVPCEKQDKRSKDPKICKKEVSTDCGVLTTFYKTTEQDSTVADSAATDSSITVDSIAAKPFKITSPSQVSVCDPGSVTIEGTFDQTDPNATLYVTMKNYKSRNLVPLSANGEFSHTITISDVLRNWNETKVSVEYHGKNGTETQEVELSVNKTCKQVNQLRPMLTFVSSDSVKCLASFSLVGATDDLVYLTREVDGGNAKGATFTKNTIYTAALTPGLHTYTLQAEDQAGNKSTLKKELGCYPLRIPRIEISGPTEEPVRAPPPPPRASLTLYKNMRFRITGVSQQDPIHIKHIKVVQDNTTILDISGTQITELDYSIPVSLERNTKSTIKVFVEMKNGRKIFGKKIYGVN